MTDPLYQSEASGSSDLGVDLNPHVTGNPVRGASGAYATAGHTFLMFALGLGLLWVFVRVFKSVRM